MIALNKESKDFLKLLFTYSHIKLLKSILKDKEDRIILLTNERDDVVNKYQSLVKVDKLMKQEVRKTAYIQNILTLNKSLRQHNKALRRKNNDLVGELVILQQKLDELKPEEDE